MGEFSIQKLDRQQRCIVLFCIGSFWAFILIARLFALQVSDTATWEQWAVRQHFSEIQIASKRAPVTDRNGKFLAVSVPAQSLYVRPHLVNDKERLFSVLGDTLKISRESLEKKLQSKSPFVWLRRQIPAVLARKIQALKIAGVGSVPESKRYYPYGTAGSILIGRVGVDGSGLSGLEQRYNHHLSGSAIRTQISRDAFGQSIAFQEETESALLEVQEGDTLQLTIDAEVQAVLDNELALAKKKEKAKATFGIMIDAETGEVLALGQSPSPDFNQRGITNVHMLKNRLVEAVFEPGSVMKPLVAAAALEEELVRTGEIIDCENGQFRFGRKTIRDVHPLKKVSFREVVVQSSNIGMAKVGMRMGPDRIHEWFGRFGFGKKSGLGLPGESSGILRSSSSWAKIDTLTHSFGQGVAVTPLQIVRAIAAIAADGVMPDLRILHGEYPSGTRVLSSTTAEAVENLLYGVVEEEEGTGNNARIPNFAVGGKTGTAQKARVDGRGYEPDKYISSFVGFVKDIVPGKTVVLLITVDEPNGESIYGGVVAAPVFQNVIRESAEILRGREVFGSEKEFSPSEKPQEFQQASYREIKESRVS